MCFRPGDVEAPIICPECNNRIPIVAGFRPKTCSKCGADLPEPGAAPAVGSPKPPAAPGAPQAPAAPKAPGA